MGEPARRRREQRPCSGDHADAAQRVQRPPAGRPTYAFRPLGECREGFSLSAGGRRGCPPAAPKTPLGREGGSNHAHVAPTTPTPPIAPNAPFHTLRVDGHQQYGMTQPRGSAEGDSPSAGVQGVPPSPFTPSTTCSTIAVPAAPHRLREAPRPARSDRLSPTVNQHRTPSPDSPENKKRQTIKQSRGARLIRDTDESPGASV